ncbi:MAG: PQQ-binding-like beta-propeller repeat protein [Rhodospirillaceae bacterium]|nr:PQQ-binding-like beta-propeller repeat protein [Rhodospirillaceae bacterium]
MMRMSTRCCLVAVAAGLVLSACDNNIFTGESDKEILPGTRISVLALERELRPDLGAIDTAIRLPRPEDAANWPQAGGLSHHAMHHMVLGENPERQWSKSIGEGSGKRNRVLAEPIIANGRAFTMDAEARVRAFDARTGQQFWSTKTAPKSDDEGSFLGGGLAFDNGRVFATGGYAQVVALDAEGGKEVWRASVEAPIRAAPTVNGGRVFVVTVENQVVALAASTGRQLWTYSAASTPTILMGGAAPAVDGGVVIAPFTNGEVVALRVDNGSLLWNETVVAVRRTEAAASLPDIAARPVIDRGRVYVVGHSGVIVAIDLRTGQRVWDAPVSGVYGPWIAGDFLYVISIDAEVVCIDVRSGRILWVTQLPRFEDEEDKDGRIVWAGPVVASDRVIVVGSNEQALSLSPYSGEVLSRMDLDAAATLPPVLAGSTMYLLDDDGDLVAYR